MARCSRVWEVEAARDRRLGEKARIDRERHLEQCEDCAAETRALDGLGERLRALDVRMPDELTMRRLRGRTLERADAAVAEGEPSRRFVRFAPWLAFAAALIAVVGWRATRSTQETHVTVSDEGGARWSSHRDGATERVDLLDGSLALRIDHPAAGGRRVVVRVPDGEIEDVGTVFHVSVANGGTSRIRVDTGRVIVRIGATAPKLVGAGETWERNEEATAGVAPSSGPSSAAEPLVVAPSSLPPARSSGVTAERPKATAAAPLPSASDGAEEDRVYSQVVRLLREGHEAEAKAAARDYLRRFPNGFRRSEMERVGSDR